MKVAFGCLNFFIKPILHNWRIQPINQSLSTQTQFNLLQEPSLKSIPGTHLDFPDYLNRIGNHLNEKKPTYLEDILAGLQNNNDICSIDPPSENETLETWAIQCYSGTPVYKTMHDFLIALTRASFHHHDTESYNKPDDFPISLNETTINIIETDPFLFALLIQVIIKIASHSYKEKDDFYNSASNLFYGDVIESAEQRFMIPGSTKKVDLRALKTGDIIANAASVLSTSQKFEVTKQFMIPTLDEYPLFKNKGTDQVIFKFKDMTSIGANIATKSMHPRESEVILPKLLPLVGSNQTSPPSYTHFEVISVKKIPIGIEHHYCSENLQVSINNRYEIELKPVM